MTAQGDRDWFVAADPRTPPAQLASIASRRWDLHAIIAANPSAYPALRQWMATVNGQPGGPAATQPQVQPQPYGPGQPAWGPRPRRRSGALGGCLIAVVVGVVVLVGLGGLLSSLDSPFSQDDQSGPTAAPTTSSELDAYLADFAEERRKIDELAAVLDGNPVAPLVLDPTYLARLDERAANETIAFSAQTLAQQAQQVREELEQLVAEAEARRGNASGLLSEALVDEAADGFVDVQWDADTACDPQDEPGSTTIGCVVGDSLVIHLLPDSELSGDWEVRMLVTHELAHIFQRADRTRFEDRIGDADRLVEQGYFRGDLEMMADCYALTFYDEWTLETDEIYFGYGYVCDEAEREAIRDWAAGIDAPISP